jgi:hypothetical protein
MLLAGRPEESSFYSRQKQEFSLFSITTRTALGPTQFSNQWMPEDIFPGNKATGA